MALTKLTLAARNAFEAYLIVSADAGSVTISGACRCSNSEATRMAAAEGGARAGAPDHDAMGVEEVVPRRALAQELGVRHDVHVGPSQCLLDDACRPDGDGGLVDHHRLGRQHRPDLGRGGLDVREI